MELKRDSWSERDYSEYIKYLRSLGEQKYRDFSIKLIPGTNNIIGIRMPQLRAAAKKISKGNTVDFIAQCKYRYHEEIIIAGLVLAGKKCGYGEMLSDIYSFIPHIGNWAVCDCVSFKNIKNHKERFLSDIDKFIYSEDPWAQRFGFGALMQFYLDDEHIDKVLYYLDSVNSDHYYVCMMQAWLAATAYAKCRDKVHIYLAGNHLNDKTMNMAISKIRDSYRIEEADKAYAKSLKRI